MRFPTGLLGQDEIRDAVDAELDSPARQLPPSSIHPALQGRRDEVASWASARLQSTFVPTPEETVFVNKAGHGVRPVAVWDLPSRLAYGALAQSLRHALPSFDRGRVAWHAFQRAPLDVGGDYIVVSDIAACYQFVDHGLLGAELLAQTGDHATVEAIKALLHETGGRTYGLPQQSAASDVLAEAFLRRLERALVRRGLSVARYNDDFRFTCAQWSDVVRSIEVFAEEARLHGLTVNDLKTVPWGTVKYRDHLDEADRLRKDIADEAEIDLTQDDLGYDGDVVTVSPEKDDIDRLASVRVLERWARVAGRGRVPQSRRIEHRAVLQLLPAALKTLEAEPSTDQTVLVLCTKLLRYERTMTPAVSTYLASRDDETAVLSAFDKLLNANPYLNGWQNWWLQQPLARHSGFSTGIGAKRRLAWAHNALTSAEHAPVLRAHAALTLSRHGQIDAAGLLRMYDRSSASVRPVLAAAVALREPEDAMRDAVTGDSTLNLWAYEWARLHA